MTGGFENSIHFQDKNLYHVCQGSYSEKLRTRGPGGEAPGESRGVWALAGLSIVGIFMKLKGLSRGMYLLVKYYFDSD